jgi:hypothetical protein
LWHSISTYPTALVYPTKTAAEIKELSDVVASVARAQGLSGDEDFRNVNGVYMKLMNFMSLDPTYTTTGRPVSKGWEGQIAKSGMSSPETRRGVTRRPARSSSRPNALRTGPSSLTRNDTGSSTQWPT